MSAPAPERSVLVTGASSGIGACAAQVLRARGWRVFAGARKREDVARLADEGFEAVRLDYQDEAGLEAAAREVLERGGGRLGALFNNGAYAQPGALEDVPAHAFRAQFEANVIGWHTLTRALVPAMRAAGAGRVVNCSSVLGLVALKYRGAYVASKFALEGYSDALRLELKGSGVAVSLIEPGPIATRFTENALAQFRAHIDVAASPHAAAYAVREARLARGGASRFKLAPEAVADRLVHALESARPRARYPVTTPSWAMAAARRLLPGRALDRLLAAASDRET